MTMRFALLAMYGLLGLLISGCSLKQDDKNIDLALSRAKENRTELEKVINHYKDKGDSCQLKLEAVKFLIANSLDKYYLAGKGIEQTNAFLDSVYTIEQTEYDVPAIYDAFYKSSKSQNISFQVCFDLEELNSDFIIRNVEESFDIWQNPKLKHLSFDDFCEYILPHRISNEEPELWKTTYRDRFNYTLQQDSDLSLADACNAVNEELKKLSVHITTLSIRKSAIRPSSLINIKFGLCDDYALYATYVMRSLGLPVGIAAVPHWGRGDKGHSFNVILTEDGSLLDFSGAEDGVNDHLSRFHGYTKVYQKTFSIQEGSLALKKGEEQIPRLFNDPCLVDITDNFPFINSVDVMVEVPKNSTPNKFVYLCVFSPRDAAGWTPVCWGEIDRGNAVTFKNIGADVVYQLASYENNSISPIGFPFLLDSLGKTQYYIPTELTRERSFERKYTDNRSLQQMPKNLVGGKFQGANTANFRDAEDLHIIDTPPKFKYTAIDVATTKPYKYYRYLASDETYANMGELEFYEKETGNVLKGKVIGDYEPSSYFFNSGPEKMFDNDALSFFHSGKKGSWGGIELLKPAHVDRIRFLIRNDDNGVRKGQLYELFYMDNGSWASLGAQTETKDDRILFDNVPDNALYWLRNHSKGKEERIFSIDNDSIIWM